MAKTVYDIIKKQNGERFAKAIRNYDNGIFDIPNIVDIVKYAGRDAEPIMRFLVGLKNVTVADTGVKFSPFELLHKAGYHAEYADTLEKQNDIKKYFAKGEELCTFKDDKRYQKYHILNVVRYDVDKIQRQNFANPQREDEYGTSVMSIQILKSGGFISIKNRYNHTVENPDNTYGSNPDNIIYGLSAALRSYFDIDFSSRAEMLPNWYAFINDRIIKYHHEIENMYFGEDFYVKDGVVHQINKDHEILMDYFLLDLKRQTIKNLTRVPDGFEEAFQQEINNKKMSVSVYKNQNGQTIRQIMADGVVVAEVENGEIIKVVLNQAIELEDGFMVGNFALQKIELPNVRMIGSEFLFKNENLTDIFIPNVEYFGDDCLWNNLEIKNFDAPALRRVGRSFMTFNRVVQKFNTPSLVKFGTGSLALLPDLREKIMVNVLKSRFKSSALRIRRSIKGHDSQIENNNKNTFEK